MWGGGNPVKSGNKDITIPTTHKAAASVSFDESFSAVPNVVVSANKTGYGNGCFVNVGNITTSGFNIYAEDDLNTSAYTLNVCWMATV